MCMSESWHETADPECQHVQVILQERRSLADRHAELHADRARLEAQIAADAEHRARLEMEQERARITDLRAEAEHRPAKQAREIDRLSVKLERARRPWW